MEKSTRVLAVLFLTGSLVAPTAGQVELRFSGYAVSLSSYQRTNPLLAASFGVTKDQASNLMRIRLRPAVDLWNGAELSLEHETNALYQSSSPPFISGSVSGRRQAFDLRCEIVTKSHFTLSTFVDRFYFRQDFSSSSLIVGRQRISWGTGRVWNPTDLFNPINPANFSKVEKDGADAVSFKYYAENFTDLEIVFNAEDRFRLLNYGARLRTNTHEFDISVMAGSFERGFVLGGDCAGNLLNAGVRGEMLYSANRSVGGYGYVRFIVGADYQLSSLLYALLEYQYNGEGTTEVARYDFTGVLSGRTLNVGRHYLSANTVYQLHPLISISVGVNINLIDGSGFLFPLCSYSASSDISISVGGILVYGAERTEYWHYPLSLYARAEWFF